MPKFFENAAAFRKWLTRHAKSTAELLVGFHKVGSGRPSMLWAESVDEALCVGWIDGVRRRIDEGSYSIRFTPRRPTSIWSAINIAKFHQLQSDGRMTPAGERAFAMRKDERSAVYAYEQEVPAELLAGELQRFNRNAAAWAYYLACPPGYKKVILHWITSAKRAETRASRLDTLIKACADGMRLR